MHLARTLMPLNTVKKPQHRPAPVELIQIRARVAEEADAEGDLVRLRQRRQIAHMHFFRQARLCAALLRHAPQRLHAREKEKHCGGERQGDGKHPHHITPAGELHPRPPQLLEAQQPAQADHQRKEQIEKHRNRLRIHQKRQHQQHLQQKQHMHIAAVARFQQLAHAHRHQHRHKRHRHPHRIQARIHQSTAGKHQHQRRAEGKTLAFHRKRDKLQHHPGGEQHPQFRRQKEKQRQGDKQKRRGHPPPLARIQAVMKILGTHPADHAPPPNSAKARKQASRCSRP